jgi:hypothetical protein
MGGTGSRFGVGTRLIYDGEVVEIVEMMATAAGNEVVLRSESSTWSARRVSVRELLTAESVRVIPVDDGPSAGDENASASVVLAALSESELDRLTERARHVCEVLTGFRSGSAELAAEGEPRPAFAPGMPLASRYAAKAAELDVGVRTVRRWVGEYRRVGAAGLVDGRPSGRAVFGSNDSRWADTALEVMAEHTDFLASVADDGDRADEREGGRTVRDGCGGLAFAGDGVPDSAGTGTAQSVVPVEHEAEPGYRRASGRCLREAAPDSSG